MDYLELDNLEYAVNLLKEKPEDNGCTDEKRAELLNKLKLEPNRKVCTIQKYTLKGWNADAEKRICEIFPNVMESVINNDIAYEQGCSEAQIDAVKGILLSAEYNFKKAEDKLLTNRQTVENDIINRTYGGKTLYDLDNLRLKGADAIKASKGFVAEVGGLATVGTYILGALKELAQVNMIGDGVENNFTVKAAERMIKDGCSLKDITYCLKANPYVVYKLADGMYHHYILSPEEQELVREGEKAYEKTYGKPFSREEAAPGGADKIPEKFNRAQL